MGNQPNRARKWRALTHCLIIILKKWNGGFWWFSVVVHYLRGAKYKAEGSREFNWGDWFKIRFSEVGGRVHRLILVTVSLEFYWKILLSILIVPVNCQGKGLCSNAWKKRDGRKLRQKHYKKKNIIFAKLFSNLKSNNHHKIETHLFYFFLKAEDKFVLPSPSR